MLAYDLIHANKNRTGPFATIPTQVGIALNMMDFLPDRWWHIIERIAANRVNRYYNQAWIQAVRGEKQDFWVLHVVPTAPEVSEARGRRTVDFFGVNYYFNRYISFNVSFPA